MAVKLKKPNPSLFHSHSLRTTGPTLLAMAGRSEEDIMPMGEWTSSSAAKRYIEDSMLTKRKKGEAISIPCYTKPENVKAEKKKSSPVRLLFVMLIPSRDPILSPLALRKKELIAKELHSMEQSIKLLL